MTSLDATVVALRERPEHCAFFAAAFEAEWPSWYGPGGRGNAQADLLAFADPSGSLPVGVVAIGAGHQPLGVAALKASSIPSHAHLSPWAAAGYVVPSWRRKGIGALLLTALLGEASRLGFECVYCATATSQSLLVRQGWSLIEEAVHEGRVLHVFRSGLSSHAMLADARHGGYQSPSPGP
ncbi:MAG: GNAT family N-acetyltransferase [Rubrivivax sp.]